MATQAVEAPLDLRLAVLQPTSLCNLNCSYCYVPGRRESDLMSDSVVEAAAAFIFAAAPQQRSFKFLWHAGEPLTAGLAFYRQAFSIIDRVAQPGIAVSHTIQTNGTLISTAWCELFRQYAVNIGISVDGPAELHDSSRKTWGKRGSHDRVMRGYHLLRSYGINPGALCVLTRESLRCADAIYDFFADTGFAAVGFNVEEVEGANLVSSLGRGTADEVLADYRRFMRRLWFRWRADGGRLRIREFDDELRCIHQLQANPGFVREPDEVIPFCIVTIRKDGGISTFAPELATTPNKAYSDFVLGNVLTDGPADVRARAAFERLMRDVARGRDACERSCPYYALCGGGFQSNRIAEHGTLLATETLTCRIHRMALADVVLGELLTESQGHAPPHGNESATTPVTA
jgi:uncharacterized protein